MSGEEEAAALQQFLRFGETKPLVELMAAQDQEEPPLLLPPAAASVDIRALLESCSQRGAGLSGPGARGSPAHPFENLVNNMAFLLPFQLLNPVPPALIGALPEPYLLEQAPAPQPQPEARAPLPEDHPSLAQSPRGRAGKEPGLGCPETVQKREGGAPVGDSSPYPVVTHMERAQLSPEAKAKPERGGLGARKGRVFCSACEKTFYDKGTLKIHYNAVHLKIKHKCTVQGCNMVFSSLRSRNRHSANPNPRLHAPANRNSRDRDLRLGLGLAPPAPSPAPRGAPPPRPSLGHHGVLFPNLRTVQPVLPFYRSPATPAELALTPGVLPSLPLLSSSAVPEQLASTTMPFDPLPKKKSRKSSMPVKIEKEAVGLAPEKTLSSGEARSLHCAAEEQPGPRSAGSDGAPPAGVLLGVALSGARRPGHGGSGLESRGALSHTPEPATCPSERDAEWKPGRTETPGDSEDGGLGRAACSTEPCVRLPRRVLTAGLFGGLDPGQLALPGLEDPEEQGLTGQQGFSRREGEPRFQCGACKKTFKNVCGVKLHHKNTHAREAHMCAARRSRDR
ncbi:Zinc finger protein basonuclin-1 [Galemys pyrenaicus]|uniref:Zinc finger protein basonuclin-1 n=1 Tax=Galemys pyrenaicus TaxID=202257 RepID=A0A8J6ADI1_GALPY|nr:Zinc finger protein basonuclin-1 [Galemys pyrenaicus]